jgi:methylation protein EvaC
MRCKITHKEIKPFMSFGKMPIANGFIEKKDFNCEFFFNMEVGFSEDLSLFQLKDHPSPEQMFNSKYPFFTG